MVENEVDSSGLRILESDSALNLSERKTPILRYENPSAHLKQNQQQQQMDSQSEARASKRCKAMNVQENTDDDDDTEEVTE